jgi:hypothetical protein
MELKRRGLTMHRKKTGFIIKKMICMQRQGEVIVKCICMKRIGSVINEEEGDIGERKGADRCQSFGVSGLEGGAGGVKTTCARNGTRGCKRGRQTAWVHFNLIPSIASFTIPTQTKK